MFTIGAHWHEYFPSLFPAIIRLLCQVDQPDAALCQEAGMVPIVEPEVLMDGEHTLEQCRVTTEDVLHNVFVQLYTQRVILEGMIVKPNMVLVP